MSESKRKRWLNRSDEGRNRCRATERRGTRLVQCSEDRRDRDHVHMNRGVVFGPDYSMPTPGGPTLAPPQVKPR